MMPKKVIIAITIDVVIQGIQIESFARANVTPIARASKLVISPKNSMFFNEKNVSLISSILLFFASIIIFIPTKPKNAKIIQWSKASIYSKI
ncbi:hypothetical protein SDC9_206958 [bioreactor metagenome]|uniref:Uncharacterized protein n=1 Tax=bioreactor metagenome TaxID=1076179 RepID=A0A645J760_9ZZZZ